MERRVYNSSVYEGYGKTWGNDCGDISLPWQEVETGHHTANLEDLYKNAWAQIRSDNDYMRANRYSSY